MHAGRWTCRRPARGGFTLIEILLVVVIIGMLAGIAAVAVPRHIDDARRATTMAGIRSVGVAIASYYMKTGRYPATLDLLTAGEDPYLEGGVPKDAWGQPLQYAFPGAHRPLKYDLFSWGKDGVASDDDLGNWQQAGAGP